MIMRKETLVFLTSLAIIFIIGYVNMTMTPKNTFDEEDYAQFEEEVGEDAEKEDTAQIVEDSEPEEFLEQTDKTDIATANQPADDSDSTPEDGTEAADAETPEEAADAETPEEEDYVILGDITDILDKKPDDESVTASSDSAGILDALNSSFANFKLNKEKDNLDIIDHLEESLSNESISADTKSQFEALLLSKNEFVETEKDIELMLQSKGYNETVVIVDQDVVKVVTNDTIEQADATKILDVIVSETNYEPSQIKIVKFDNIDL